MRPRSASRKPLFVLGAGLALLILIVVAISVHHYRQPEAAPPEALAHIAQKIATQRSPRPPTSASNPPRAPMRPRAWPKPSAAASRRTWRCGNSPTTAASLPGATEARADLCAYSGGAGIFATRVAKVRSNIQGSLMRAVISRTTRKSAMRANRPARRDAGNRASNLPPAAGAAIGRGIIEMNSTRKLSRRSFLTRVAGGAVVGGGALLMLPGKAQAQVSDNDTGPHADRTGRAPRSPHAGPLALSSMAEPGRISPWSTIPATCW